ncbi:MAG: phospho-sugar mutase [Atopobiaceae bacterium]|nr:phospho-sugar mutase [Atopobiaceae bacterium]
MAAGANEQRWFQALKKSVQPWELERLQQAGEREDAFCGHVRFGTGGIRAKMGIGPNRLNRLTVAKATMGLVDCLRSGKLGLGNPLVVIAYDTRIHSEEFAVVCASVLASAGIRSLLFDVPQPTPVLSYAVRQLHANAGVVITASHNSKEYNGFKVYDSAGDQATDSLAHAVQDAMCNVDPFGVPSMPLDEALGAGLVDWVDSHVVDDYVRAVLEQSTGVRCFGLHVVYTPLNGAGCAIARRVLASRGISYSLVRAQAVADGTFATCPKPNPEHAAALSLAMEQALAEGADLALANDPDADRIGAAVRCDKSMRLLTGDEMGLLLLDFLCKVVPLPARPVAITTIVSSPLLNEVASAHGVRLRRTLTGFKYVGEQVDLLEEQGRVSDFLVGVEESCGYLRGSYVRDKDGIVSLMLLCEMAAWHKRRGKNLLQALDELYEQYGYVVSEQVAIELDASDEDVPVRDGSAVVEGLRACPPKALGIMPVRHVVDYAQGVPMPGDPTQTLPRADVLQLNLDGGCKVIVRPSGTEPKIKAYCFAKGSNADQARERLACLVEAIRNLLSV